MHFSFSIPNVDVSLTGVWLYKNFVYDTGQFPYKRSHFLCTGKNNQYILVELGVPWLQETWIEVDSDTSFLICIRVTLYVPLHVRMTGTYFVYKQ